MAKSSPCTEPVDREALWGDAQRSMVWRDRVEHRAICKALNLPVDGDDMEIHQQYGWGWKELAVTLAALVVGLGAWIALSKPEEPAPQRRPAVTTPDRDTARQFSIGPYQPAGASNARADHAP